MFFKHKEKKISESEQRFNNFMEEYKAQRFGTSQPPTRIVKDGGTKICHCEPQKSKPNPPRSQYGSIDNSELDILLKSKESIKTNLNLDIIQILLDSKINDLRTDIINCTDVEFAKRTIPIYQEQLKICMKMKENY